MLNMKLFEVNYIDDCEDGTFLMVGNSKEEVEERIRKKSPEEFSCYMRSWIHEIDEVDGHKIIVE